MKIHPDSSVEVLESHRAPSRIAVRHGGGYLTGESGDRWQQGPVEAELPGSLPSNLNDRKNNARLDGEGVAAGKDQLVKDYGEGDQQEHRQEPAEAVIHRHQQ